MPRTDSIVAPAALAAAAPLLAVSLVAAAPADPIGAAAEKLMAAARIPGMQVLVADHGRIVASRSFGVKDLTTKAPVDEHTRFEIGSITKQFTAAAVLQLKERGKLKLSDTLGRYITDYPAAKDVTLEQLLRQVSGVPNFTDLPAFNAMVATQDGRLTISERGDAARIIALVKDKPLDFAPGTKWAYSNTNYALLGRIIEIASGMPWAQYVRANIFAPAGMTESAFMDDEGGIADIATGYGLGKAGLVPTTSFNGWAGAAGAIVSTAGDMAKWDAALLGGKIVSADDLAAMLHPGSLPSSNPRSHYGFGWVVDEFDAQPRVWHNGGTLGFAASNHVYPGLSQTIIVLVNNSSSSSDAVANAVFDALHPALAAAAAPKAAPGEDARVTARVKRIWDEVVAGRIDRDEFTERAATAITAVLPQASAQFKSFGTPTSWTYAGSTVAGGVTAYDYRVALPVGLTLTVTMAVTADGKITGYQAHQ